LAPNAINTLQCYYLSNCHLSFPISFSFSRSLVKAVVTSGFNEQTSQEEAISRHVTNDKSKQKEKEARVKAA